MKIARRDFIRQTMAGAAAVTAAGFSAPSANAVDGQAATTALQPESFCFCVAADPHCGEPPKEGLETMGDGVAKFVRCFEVLQGLDEAERPDFLLVAGDVHPWALLGHEDKLAIPVYATAGNHESSREKRQQLRQVFGRGFERDGKESDYYSFVHKGVRFVAMCDAGSGGDHVGHLCSETISPAGQCEWLEQELAQPEPKILFAHIPPQPDGADVTMYLSRNDSRWFRELVERTKPQALFFGHLHKPTEEYSIGETRCFNVRSCCWNFGRAPLGLLHVRVTPAGLQVRELETERYTA